MAVAQARDLLPEARGHGIASALDRLHRDAAGAEDFRVASVVVAVLVVDVWRRVAHEEHDLQGRALRPGELVDGGAEGGRDVLGRVATAVRLEGHEPLVDLVHVPREVVHARDVLVGQVAVADEGDPQVGAGPALADAARDRPDLPLGPVDEPAHAPGGVENEGDLDAGPGHDGRRGLRHGHPSRRIRAVHGRRRRGNGQEQDRNQERHGRPPGTITGRPAVYSRIFDSPPPSDTPERVDRSPIILVGDSVLDDLFWRDLEHPWPDASLQALPTKDCLVSPRVSRRTRPRRIGRACLVSLEGFRRTTTIPGVSLDACYRWIQSLDCGGKRAGDSPRGRRLCRVCGAPAQSGSHRGARHHLDRALGPRARVGVCVEAPKRVCTLRSEAHRNARADHRTEEAQSHCRSTRDLSLKKG